MNPSSSDATVAQQLEHLANMAERVATPMFQQGFRASVATRAAAAHAFLTYRDEQGHLVREWPESGRIEVIGR